MVSCLVLAICVAGAIADAPVLEQVRFTRPEPPEADVPEVDRLRFEMPRAEQPPTIDGRLQEDIWQTEAASLGTFRLGLSATPARHTREAWAAYDRQNLYFGVKLEREPGTELRVQTLEPDDGAIWEDDEVEVFIDPFRSGTSYYQMILNSEGVLYDASHRVVEVPDPRAASPGATRRERVTDDSWDSGLRRAVHIEDEWWSIEMALPLGSIGLAGAPAGHRLSFNITSADWDTEEYTTLSPVSNWHDPRQFGVGVLGEPRVRVIDLDMSGVGPGRNLLTVEVEHLQGPEGRYELSLRFEASGQWLHNAVQFDLGAGERGRAGVPFTVEASEGPWEAAIELSDPTGRLVFATRRTGALPGPMQVTLGSLAALTDSPPIRLSARLGVGRLTARRLSLSARLLDGADQVVAEQEIGAPDGPGIEAVVPVAHLQPGAYTVELVARREGETVAVGRTSFRLAPSPFDGIEQ